MPTHIVRCDLGDDYNGTVYAGQIVDEPIEFENGLAEVEVDDEETARRLATLHKHLEYVGPATDAADDPEADSEDETIEPPFSPSDLTIDELSEQLAEGDYSPEELDALAAAEQDGKDRDGALEAIDDAREE